VSYHFHPHTRRVASPPWVLERRRLLHLRRCSIAGGRAATRAWRVVTAPACAHVLRRAAPSRAAQAEAGPPSHGPRALCAGPGQRYGRGPRALCTRAEPALWPWAARAVHMGRAGAVGVGRVHYATGPSADSASGI
jgi:hypothetical protein